jgi:hypothetical protein
MRRRRRRRRRRIGLLQGFGDHKKTEENTSARVSSGNLEVGSTEFSFSNNASPEITVCLLRLLLAALPCHPLQTYSRPEWGRVFEIGTETPAGINPGIKIHSRGYQKIKHPVLIHNHRFLKKTPLYFI